MEGTTDHRELRALADSAGSAIMAYRANSKVRNDEGS